MKIAIVSLQFEETSTGGGGVHVENISRHFVKQGHPVTILSIHTNSTIKKHTLKQENPNLSIEKRNGIKIVRFLIDKDIEHPYVGTKEEELDRIKRFAMVTIEWLKKKRNEFDVVCLQGHHILPGFMAKELKKTGFTIVSTIHALESTFISRSGESLGSFTATQDRLTKLREWEAMTRFADFVVLNSPSVRDEYLELLKNQGFRSNVFSQKVKLISSGCDADFLMDETKVQKKFRHFPEIVKLITFCRLDPSKGIEFSIAGAREAATVYTGKLQLSIMGIPAEDNYLSKLYAEAKHLPQNLEVKFHLFNAISPPNEKKLILDDKHIYVIPTLKEPFGMSIIEASARGNMVVATDTTGPLYMMTTEQDAEHDWGIITPYGILARLTENHHKNLAKNIGKAIVWSIKQWENLAERITAFNRKIKMMWTWEEISNQYLKLFYASQKKE